MLSCHLNNNNNNNNKKENKKRKVVDICIRYVWKLTNNTARAL